jgi:OmpA family protein
LLGAESMRSGLVLVLLAWARGAVADVHGMPPAVLMRSFGGGHGGGRAPHGWFFGVDTGWAWLVGGGETATRTTTPPHWNAWCFGARGGYQLRSGLAIQTRYDHLGVTAADGNGELGIASAGVRYAFPMAVEPFAEAMFGPAFHGGSVSPAAALGAGLSLLASRHVAFDLTVRDWIVDLGGVRHAPSVTFGITAGFGG